MSTNKVLILSPAWVGDVVMAQTLFKFLKQRNPEIIIDVLSPEWGRSLLQRMPEVREVHTQTFKHGELSLGKRWSLGRELAKEKYQQVIILSFLC